MRTIRIERIDKQVPVPTGNPILLFTTEDATIHFGNIRQIKCGIRFFFPDDVFSKIEMSIPGLNVIGQAQNPIDGELYLVVLCSAFQVQIGRLQRIGKMYLHKVQLEPVRFAEFSDGKRMIAGGAEEVEHHTDVPTAKP